MALLIAAVSDAMGYGLGFVPPIQWLLDAITAGLLVAVIGFSWPLLLAMIVEVIPALELFPAWTLVVLAAAGTSRFQRGAGTNQ